MLSTKAVLTGPQLLVLGFTSASVTMQTGQDNIISEAWLGQFLYDDQSAAPATATAIEVLGNDNVVSNTWIWSSHMGIQFKSSTVLYNGMHIWGTGNYTDFVLMAPIRGVCWSV